MVIPHRELRMRGPDERQEILGSAAFPASEGLEDHGDLGHGSDQPGVGAVDGTMAMERRMGMGRRKRRGG